MIEDTPLDFDFSIGRQGPRRLTVADFNEATELEASWLDLLIFGESDYAEGGGASMYIGVRESDGAVYGLDVEREQPLALFNSSFDRFIETFFALDAFYRQGQQLPRGLEERIRGIDPEAYPFSEWPLFVAQE